MARHVRVERITKMPTESRAWPSGVLSCFKHHRPCTRRCRCHNCKNDYNNNGDQQNRGKESIVGRGCRCGSTRRSKTDEPSKMSCRDGKRKSKCPCVAEGIGCTELCSCFNCGNIVRARVKPVTPTPMRKRKRELVSSYKRKRGQEFMESEKAPVDLGPWRVLETLCLIVCRDVLVINTIVTTSTNLKVLSHLAAKNFILHQMVPSLKAFPLMVTSKASSSGRAKWGLMFLLYISINL